MEKKAPNKIFFKNSSCYIYGLKKKREFLLFSKKFCRIESNFKPKSQFELGLYDSYLLINNSTQTYNNIK